MPKIRLKQIDDVPTDFDEPIHHSYHIGKTAEAGKMSLEAVKENALPKPYASNLLSGLIRRI